MTRPPRRQPSRDALGPRNRLTSITLLLCLVGVAPACSSIADERCEAMCACTECTETDHSACRVNLAAEEDTAAAYGCSETYERYTSCELTKARCRDNRFFLDGIDCSEEAQKLTTCRSRSLTE
ncbi:hypothetical protein [Chondromyces crocatus]|uniref:Uncharacterized protein n=1 Tax=Chondromyces crocatus TaxID=52 RepID=A0A0K1EEU6_CHOCO|nr:hypothetical protein [Chondromyces crocatus]AKT39396.1 uncharacterized protein CMC5_035430 [Chondromyces crocatus]